ncbi:hypothetical protein ACLBWS_03695 [Brucellaceae bacterium D45D]
MTATTWLIIFVVWLLGAVATNAAQRVIGEASDNTIGDSLSGDDVLDVILIIIWPVFWPCFIVHIIASKATEAATYR